MRSGEIFGGFCRSHIHGGTVGPKAAYLPGPRDSASCLNGPGTYCLAQSSARTWSDRSSELAADFSLLAHAVDLGVSLTQTFADLWFQIFEVH